MDFEELKKLGFFWSDNSIGWVNTKRKLFVEPVYRGTYKGEEKYNLFEYFSEYEDTVFFMADESDKILVIKNTSKKDLLAFTASLIRKRKIDDIVK
jgi:hypothetical protein